MYDLTIIENCLSKGLCDKKTLYDIKMSLEYTNGFIRSSHVTK